MLIKAKASLPKFVDNKNGRRLVVGAEGGVLGSAHWPLSLYKLPLGHQGPPG